MFVSHSYTCIHDVLVYHLITGIMWYQLAYATEIKSIQLRDSIERLSLKDSILYIHTYMIHNDSAALAFRICPACDSVSSYLTFMY